MPEYTQTEAFEKARVIVNQILLGESFDHLPFPPSQQNEAITSTEMMEMLATLEGTKDQPIGLLSQAGFSSENNCDQAYRALKTTRKQMLMYIASQAMQENTPEGIENAKRALFMATGITISPDDSSNTELKYLIIRAQNEAYKEGFETPTHQEQRNYKDNILTWANDMVDQILNNKHNAQECWDIMQLIEELTPLFHNAGMTRKEGYEYLGTSREELYLHIAEIALKEYAETDEQDTLMIAQQCYMEATGKKRLERSTPFDLADKVREEKHRAYMERIKAKSTPPVEYSL